MPTWIRVRDNDTGDEFDIDPRSFRQGMTRVDGYPIVKGPGARPRPAKLRVNKDGTRQPVQPLPLPADGGPAVDNPQPMNDSDGDSAPAQPADTENEE